MDKEQSKDSAGQSQQDEDLYKLRLYVLGNHMKSKLAFDNLKLICSKYFAEKCHIEIIDLTKNPNLAREDQIIAIPTLVRKNYPGKRIIGDLSNQEKVLKFLNLRIDNFIDTVNIKDTIEKTPTDESKTRIVKSKKSKYDLQPYIGSNSCKQFSQTTYNLIFSLS